ncbi:uncharacterized protein LOC105846068 isoform X1 [Hydra vulgaris]|uniref:uncharacterized protein LOC105846068 isoform X1 n=1 Tax=Hydra vulgaris TaxID=6087 RepID=UPI001F5ED8AD|nr:uncharacterized protein LOC105846068 [Hydra vulgaris]
MNLQYLYRKENIDTYVNNIIKYQLGGFKKDDDATDYKFLLNNKFGVGNNSYYVLYLGAVDSAGKLPLDFFFDKSKQPTHEKRDDRKDVFDELLPVILLEKSCKAKILFPFNVTNIHWLTGEIVIDKNGDNVSVVLYAHNPYGGGQLSKESFSILKATLLKIIEKTGLQVTSITSLLSPFTNARQTISDETSCGIIVADELVKRITNSSLNISAPYPQGAEQLRLSQLTFLQENLGEENLNYQLFKQQVTLIDTHLEENSYIESLDYVARPPIERKLIIGEVRKKVEQIVSSEESNIVKINLLKQLEKEHYKPLVQQLAYKNSLEELKDLLIVFKDLGYLTINLGELSGELKYYTETAIFYQYIITILDEKLNEKLISTKDKNEFTKQEKLNPLKKLTHLQQLIFSTIGGDQEKIPVVQEETKTNKDLLLVLRNKIDKGMQKVEYYRQQVKIEKQESKVKYQELYVSTARALFDETASEMKKFLAKLYNDSEQQMAIIPPCKYALLGLGSMALKQMTPYSDLEFAILTENEEYKHSIDPKVRDYFKNLSYFVNFKIINLGESIIPTSKYDLDMAHLVHVAVNFDLGGKTPLGRIDKPYELIKTVEWMMYYVRNEGDKASHRDKNLPYILENVCYVHGDVELVKTYKAKVTEYLHSKNEDDPLGRLNCEVRAIKLLKEGAVEFNYLQKVSSLKPKEILFKSDLDKLQPKLFDTEGKLFDVKQEIYRLPDRMVYNLGLYFGIEGDSCWDTVDKLAEQGIINLEAASNLKNAITFATTLRLKTYSHHKAQKDDMAIYPKPAKTESELKEQAQKIFHLSEEDLEEEGGLFQYFYTAIPLYEMLEKFCINYSKKKLEQDKKNSFFKGNTFYDNGYAIKGLICYRLVNYKTAEVYLEKWLNLQENQYNVLSNEHHLIRVYVLKRTLQKIYIEFGNKRQAIIHLKDCLKISELICNKNLYRDVLVNLGDLYKFSKKYDKAISYYNKALEFTEHEDDRAGIFNNMGIVYHDIKEFDKAIELHSKSLNIFKLHCPNSINLGIAITYINLANCYNGKKEYKNAISHYNKSFKIIKNLFKGEPHFITIDLLNNMGVIYNNLGQFDKAVECLTKGLKLQRTIHKDEPSPAISDCLFNLGNIHNNMQKFDQAIEYYKESLKILKVIHKNYPFPPIRDCLFNLALTYKKIQKLGEVIKCLTECLAIERIINKNKPTQDLTNCLTELGIAYYESEKFDEAIEYLNECVEIRKYNVVDTKSISMAQTLNYLGLSHYNKGNYNTSIKFLKESLKVFKFIYNCQPHEDIIKILINIANCHAKSSENISAINFYNESLEMVKLIPNGKPCYEMSNALKGLGNVCAIEKNFKEAKKYYDQCFELLNNIYSNKTSLKEVFDSLKQLGNAYMHIIEYDKAIECFQEGLKVRKLVNSKEPDIEVANILNAIGIAYYHKKNYNESLSYGIRCLEMRKCIYADKSPLDISNIYMNLALSYNATQNFEKTIKCCVHTLRIMSNFPHSFVNAYYKEVHILTMQSIMNFIKTNSLDHEIILELITIYQGFNFSNYKAFNQFIFYKLIQKGLTDLVKLQCWFKLALILTPKEDRKMIQLINDDMLKLRSVNETSFKLWLAVAEGNTNKVKELINAGIDLDNIPLFMNSTPLIQAVIKENIDMVLTLTLGKVDINKPNNNQDQITPLYYSLGVNGQPINTKMVDLLLNRGADANKPMFNGDTPMHMAHYSGHKEAMKLLLHHGASINPQNAEGRTPLHCLLGSRDVNTATKLEIVQEFLAMYDVTIKDQSGKSITNYAQEYCPEVLPLFPNNVQEIEPVIDPIDSSTPNHKVST